MRRVRRRMEVCAEAELDDLWRETSGGIHHGVTDGGDACAGLALLLAPGVVLEK
jgi:hypothetical protein